MRSVAIAGLARSFTLEQGASFLAIELPSRASWLLHCLRQDEQRLAMLPPFGELLDTLDRTASPRLRPQSDAAAAARSLRDGHDAFESNVRALVPVLRGHASQHDWAAWSAVQRVATRVHRHLVAQRVMIAHLVASSEPGTVAEPLCVGSCNLVELCESTAEEATLFCREKHGDAPELRFDRPNGALRACTVPAYVHFSLMEVLKNALGSHVRRYGVLNLCDAPPVEVALAPSAGNAATVRVRDRGGGMSLGARQLATSFFFTTNQEREANYTYSRAFGSQFDGLGVGLPLAAAHLRYLGGDLVLSSFSESTTAYLTLDRTGGPRTDPVGTHDEYG